MEDVSKSFQSGFRGLCKNRIGKKFQQKTLKDKINNFNNMRRERRSTLIFQKRQIDDNMSPIKTTELSKIIKHAIETKNIKTNKRLEMLQKWKMEKEKQRLKEKQKAKPLFKVCKVPDEFGVPYLNVNKNIEWKTSKANGSNSQSQFAPPNHVFHAPNNIKPIYMDSVSNNVLSANLKIDLLKTNTFPNYLARDKLSTRVTHKDSIGSQRNTRATSRKQHLEILKAADNNKKSDGKIDMNKKTIKSTRNKQNSRIESKNVKSKTRETILQDIKDQYSSVPSTSISSTKVKQSSGKKCSLIHNKVITVGDSRSTSLFNTNNISNSNKSVDVKSKGKKTLKQKSGAQPTSMKISQEPLVKTVGWNCVEIIGKDSTNNEKIKTSKGIIRKYIKTPRKKHKLDISDVELISESDITEIKDSESQNISKNIEESNSSSELRELNKLEQKETDTRSGNSTIGSATGSASPDYPMDINSTELNNVFHTPQRNNICEYPLVCISPSVTACQRKSSAEKECMGQSTGELTPEFVVDILSNTSPKVGADYFMKKLNNEIHRIEEIRDVWESYKNSNKLPEEANDMINVAIGQSKLLISKKFQQFRNLIKQCKQCKYVEKPITCEDLHGFWDMTYMQVEDLNKQFNNLNALKANNWQKIIPEKKIDVRDKLKTSTSTTIKNFKKPARDIKTSDTEYIINLNAAQIGESNEFSGGYLSDKLPVTNLNGPHLTNENARTSLRVSLLTNEAKNRVSSFSGLTALKISQAIKCRVDVTPNKNILESDLTKSKKRITKSVLVKDNTEEDIKTKLVCVTETRYDNEVMESIVIDKNIVNEIDLKNFDTVLENSINKKNNVNEINLISFSPATPLRKSKRISKLK